MRAAGNSGKMSGKSFQQSEHERKHLPRQEGLTGEKAYWCQAQRSIYNPYTHSQFSLPLDSVFANLPVHWDIYLKFPKSVYSAFGHLWTQIGWQKFLPCVHRISRAGWGGALLSLVWFFLLNLSHIFVLLAGDRLFKIVVKHFTKHCLTVYRHKKVSVPHREHGWPIRLF